MINNIQPSPPIIIDFESDDLYAILGCSRGDSAATIRKAYQKLAARFHPDHGGSRDHFQKIKRAYEVLSDPEQREFYDNTGGVKPSKHDLEAKAKDAATGALLNVIEHAARGMQSMETSNLAKLAAHVIEDGLNQLRQARAEASRVRSRYEVSLKRLKRGKEAGEASPVGVVIAQKIEQEKRRHSGMGIDLEVLEMALEMVRSYSYETDPVTAYTFSSPPAFFDFREVSKWP